MSCKSLHQAGLYTKIKLVKIKGMKEYKLPYTCLINDTRNIQGDAKMSSSKNT